MNRVVHTWTFCPPKTTYYCIAELVHAEKEHSDWLPLPEWSKFPYI